MMNLEGTILRLVSGFYDVETADGLIRCRGRGKLRNQGDTPVVGDKVKISYDGRLGAVEEILPRKNVFARPPVANIDLLVIMASAVVPVTDPYLIDRIVAVAELSHCQVLVCINKSDMNRGDELFETYRKAGIPVLRTSAETGEGMEALLDAIRGKTVAFTGNSGVGKSSILNRLEPSFGLETGTVSDKLGRGRHTTRHVELYDLSCSAKVADTPGFSAFDAQAPELSDPLQVQYALREFAPYLGTCRFDDCLHGKETGCAVREAVEKGAIPQSRYQSYLRLLELARAVKPWETKKK